ncbi:MAG: hypothetical protein K2P84_07695, partial [Undibacterium sp.]|nr:hypothetical protein [Undibacterium sp.]
TIRHKTKFGIDEIEGLLEKMLEVGWVARVTIAAPRADKKSWWKKRDVGADSWVMVMNPSMLRLSEVYRLFVFAGTANTDLAKQVHSVVNDGMSESLLNYFRLR